jgi:hypothetical protein
MRAREFVMLNKPSFYIVSETDIEFIKNLRVENINVIYSLKYNKKTGKISGPSAPQVGLEPTTYGLTVRRSNQLSY